LKQSCEIAVVIPARGGSKRLKRKNIRELCGIPMIAFAIDACKNSKYNLMVWVSTDDREIQEIATEYGADVSFFRPAELARDKVFKQEVIRHATDKMAREFNYHPELVISLQANSPQIEGRHLDAGIEKLLEYNLQEVFSVDSNLIQNGAFRIMRNEYVFQRDLSTYCGVVVADIIDVHTEHDMDKVKEKMDDNI